MAFVTLSPIDLRPETDLGPNKERFLAFAVVSVFLTLGYPRHRLAWILGLAAMAGLLEASQNLVDGRHGRWHDAEVKVGGVAGAVLALALERVAGVKRRRGA